MNNNPYIDKVTGHRERIKFIIKSRQPMSKTGLLNYSYRARARVSRTVFKFVGSHKDCEKMIPDSAKYGVPTSWWATDKAMIELLEQNFILTQGTTFCIQMFSHKKTCTHIGFSAIIVEIKPIDKEKGLYEITRNNRLKRFWFRKNVKEDEHI